MQITEYIKESSKPFFSLEITPPKRGKGIKKFLTNLLLTFSANKLRELETLVRFSWLP